METALEKALRYLPAIGTVLAVGTLLIILIYRSTSLDWASGVALALIALFGFAIAATLRYAVAHIAPAPMPNVVTDRALRGRLAPLVIGIGTGGILIVAIAVLIGITYGTQTKPEASVYLGIFSSVIPVFATWVGAVIAFFFSNESFRQAAEASGAIKADVGDSEPITAPTRMIPLEKITHIVLGAPRRHAASNSEDLLKGPAADAGTYATVLEELDMRDVVWLFSNDTVTLVIVLDADKHPVAVIRKKLVPQGLAGDARLKHYFASGQNAADAVNFRWIPETATVGQGRAMLDLYRTADLFVTKTGQADEPIKGWVPDDRLL